MTALSRMKAEGLIRPEYRGMSAKQIRAVNPELADRMAAFINANKDDLRRELTGCVMSALSSHSR